MFDNKLRITAKQLFKKYIDYDYCEWRTIHFTLFYDRRVVLGSYKADEILLDACGIGMRDMSYFFKTSPGKSCGRQGKQPSF